MQLEANTRWIRFWVKSRPRISGEGDNYEDAANELQDAVGATLGVVTASFEFDPPLPKTELQAQFSTPELYCFAGSCNPFDVPRHEPIDDRESVVLNADSFFQSPVCRKCYGPTGPRSERPLVVDFVDFSDDAAFRGVAEVCQRPIGNVHIFSERFLKVLTTEEKKRLQFREVERTRRSRIKFYELLGPPGLRTVGVSGLRAGGWYCGGCGYRCFGYWVEDLNIRDFVAKRDLPKPMPSLFTIGDPPEIILCGTMARWRKLLGKGVRGLGTRPLGVVPDSRLVRVPKVKRRYR